MPALIIAAVNNVDDVEMTRRHGVEIQWNHKKYLNNNRLKIGTKNA
ncbi:hypothetical protein EBCG_01799 [Escherichia marmotae]|nr:hypothetical protein EBCG_01799 [Escherichia marmotae]